MAAEIRTQTTPSRAAILEKFNTPYLIKTANTALPSPQKYDILIRVLAASYCHTDAVFASGSMSQVLPRIGSHEFAGEILALGPAASSSGLKIGQQVGVPGRAYNPCGSCYECVHNGGDIEGYSPFCPSAGNLGLTRDGGFQDFCTVDSRQVVPIPERMTAVETAPLMCAGLTIWAALRSEEIRDARIIAIMGAGGGLGHLGVQFAARLGKEVLAVDVGAKAMSLLKGVVESLGKDGNRVAIVDAEEDKVEEVLKNVGLERVKGFEGESGVDAVIILPEAQPAFDYGMQLVRNHGTAMVVSFPDKGFLVSAKDLVFRDIRVVGSLVGRNKQLREMMTFAAEHGVRAELRTFPLEKLNELVEVYHKAEGGKLVVDMTLRQP